MDRRDLIRAHFDAYSDLVWRTDLEPKFRAEGIDGAALEGCRKVWNKHTEDRDWGWWLDSTRRLSDAELKEEIQECRAEISAIVFGRPEKTGQSAFQAILNQTHDMERQTQEPSKMQEKGREM